MPRPHDDRNHPVSLPLQPRTMATARKHANQRQKFHLIPKYNILDGGSSHPRTFRQHASLQRGTARGQLPQLVGIGLCFDGMT
jgi:hypothetical protein